MVVCLQDKCLSNEYTQTYCTGHSSAALYGVMLLVPTVTMEICLMWDPLMGYAALFAVCVCVCVLETACHQSTCQEAGFKAWSLGRKTAHNNRFSVATYYCTVQLGSSVSPNLSDNNANKT